MARMVCAALVLMAGLSAAQAQATRISNPDGTTVDVVTDKWGTVVTSYNDDGKQTDKLRYPGFSDEAAHQRLLKILSPPGAKLQTTK